MTKLNKEQVRSIVEQCQFRDWAFLVGDQGAGFYLQVFYTDKDVETLEMNPQRGRKWYVSPFSTTSEIARTCFKAVMTSLEHQGREHFLYKGARVFGPHIDVDELVQVAARTDRRIPKEGIK